MNNINIIYIYKHEKNVHTEDICEIIIQVVFYVVKNMALNDSPPKQGNKKVIKFSPLVLGCHFGG